MKYTSDPHEYTRQTPMNIHVRPSWDIYGFTTMECYQELKATIDRIPHYSTKSTTLSDLLLPVHIFVSNVVARLSHE